jgi:hypothetical protein
LAASLSLLALIVQNHGTDRRGHATAPVLEVVAGVVPHLAGLFEHLAVTASGAFTPRGEQLVRDASPSAPLTESPFVIAKSHWR